jgi:hypothetical protein
MSIRRKAAASILLAVASAVFRTLREGGGSHQVKSRAAEQQQLAQSSHTETATRRYMMYFMLPLWFVPGVLDYFWHKKTRIESTSGTTESLIHSLMMTEVGVPIVAGLLLDINAGVIALMLGAFFLHAATAIWDVAFAVERRKVLPNEQHTHSFLEMLPFCAVSFIICMHWEQFAALFGCGTEAPRFKMQLKNPPLPTRYVVSILASVFLFIVTPYGEELLRCWRAEQRGLVGRDTPECARELFAKQAS